MRRFELTLTPRSRDGARFVGHFDTLEAAQAAASEHPESEYRILDHDDGDKVVDQSP